MKFAFGDFKKNFGKKRIYADWAATTPLRREVGESMENVRKIWANPSAIYREGVSARDALEKMRATSARVLGVKPEEVYFTSGGTESNVTIIHGVLRACLERSERTGPGGVSLESLEKDAADFEKGTNNLKKSANGIHVVTTAIEHSSVLETLRLFENRGVKVTYILPGPDGVVRADEILSAVRPDTVLVTCMYVNNEIGTIQPVSKIGAGVRKIRAEKFGRVWHESRERRENGGGENNEREDDFENNALFPVFHVDASQAPLWLSCEMEGLRADAMTLDAHKMQGPKGVGALIARRHVPFEPLMTGGGQERGRRPTTESLELIAGFTTALELAQREREEKSEKAQAVQKYFFSQIGGELPGAVINGSLQKRLPNNVNISLPDISDPEMAVLVLDKAGIACSTKSSCLKGEEKSYVVSAIAEGENKKNSEKSKNWRARNTLRFTFSQDATKDDIDRIIKSLKMLK